MAQLVTLELPLPALMGADYARTRPAEVLA